MADGYREFGKLSLTRHERERVAILHKGRVIGYVELGEIQSYNQRAKLHFSFKPEYLILREELVEDQQR